MQLPTLRGPRVMLRPIGPEDVPRIAELGSAPEVARWWPGIDEAYVRDELLPDRESPSFAIVADGEVAGLIQFWEENDPEYRHAGMDLFLGVPWQGRGLGPEALWLLARWLLSERGHHRLTIDPATANEPAIRAYRKLGFRRVGVLRQYERDGEGWRDGLLMDLLADELREP